MDRLKASIRQKALSLGFCAAGFAAVRPQDVAMERMRSMIAEARHGEMHYLEAGIAEREDPTRLLPGVRTVLSVALPGPAPSFRYGESGIFSAHATVQDYHRVARGLLLELLDFIRAATGIPVEGIACVDGAPVLEKAWAESAGIGMSGKNTLIIVPDAGSVVFLGELLLAIDIEPDQPMEWDPCGTCSACLDACPTGALTAPGKLDARRCISYLTIELKREFTTEEAAMATPWIFGCDRCMAACPHNAARSAAAHPAFTPSPEIMALTAEKVLTLTGSGFRKLFAGTTVMRLGLKRLKRNARAVKRERTTGTSRTSGTTM
ncbi:MAG: tRNA epoxyqueuosine(34) reductase QueG [Chlorobiaceae bacterium]|nr:tRNA epoxyqueuosine(34) reductase QueG [Chlorobiaceae bacterium]